MSGNIKNQDGFTLPELVLSISLIAIISISLLSAITYYFAYVTRNNVAVDMTANSQNFLRSTVEELRYGSGVRQTNTIGDANAPAGGWNTSNADFVIIISVPATDSANNYIIDSITGNPYNNELVYYRQGNDLYRRKLANSQAVGNAMTTTCPPASANGTCPADTKLLENLNTVNFDLFDQDHVSTTDPLNARFVKVNLNLRKDSFGAPVTLSNSVQVALRNNF